MSEPFPILPQVDAALRSAAERSGASLACRPGCAQCCVGAFAITQLDAEVLRSGLAHAPSAVAERILHRARLSRERLCSTFPGDPDRGLLFTLPEHHQAFEQFANDEPCPLLDPATQTCDLYHDRLVAEPVSEIRTEG